MGMLVSRVGTGIGRALGLEAVVYVSEVGTTERDAIATEINLGIQISQMAGVCGEQVDLFLLVNSLPRKHSALMTPSILRSTPFRAGRLVEMGGSCGAILEALHYCFTSISPEQSGFLMCVDSFSTSYHASSAGQLWNDGGGGVYFHQNSPSVIRLESYICGVDELFLEIAHPPMGFIEDNFLPTQVNKFAAQDEINTRFIIDLACQEAGIELQNLSGIVTINRSEKSSEMLKRISPPCVPIFQSRSIRSHVGGADLLGNFDDALKSSSGHNNFYLLIGFGLGYSWHGMVVSVSS